jgi:hypothetical protein
MQVERPVARSAVSALNTLEEITVPETTGCPAELMLKTPLPEKLICFPLSNVILQKM